MTSAVEPSVQPRLSARDLDVVPPGGGEPVVSGFSLDLAAGEWVAISGANGSGKSCLLHALAGLWPVAAGTLRVDGRPLRPGDAAARSGIGVVLQDPSSQLVQPTVAEELRFPATNLGLPPHEVDARLARLAEAFGLERALAVDPASLSAGRQQALLVAAALVAKPTLLLADEPGAHLDAATRRRVLDVVADEVRSGLAVIWVTQDRAEMKAAQRLVTLGGRDSPEPGTFPAPPRSGRLARVRIAPARGDAGRRVQTVETMEFDLPARGLVALVGPNAGGKSVLLNAMAGLEPVPQVAVTWLDGPPGPASVALQYPELQVFEEDVESELVFAATARGVGRTAAIEAAAAALTSLGIEPRSFMKRRTWQIAGGERRILEVVGALIAPARLVILDEPTAGVDPVRRLGLTRLVARRAEVSCVVVASQDLEWIQQLSSPAAPATSGPLVIQVAT